MNLSLAAFGLLQNAVSALAVKKGKTLETIPITVRVNTADTNNAVQAMKTVIDSGSIVKAASANREPSEYMKVQLKKLEEQQAALQEQRNAVQKRLRETTAKKKVASNIQLLSRRRSAQKEVEKLAEAKRAKAAAEEAQRIADEAARLAAAEEAARVEAEERAAAAAEAARLAYTEAERIRTEEAAAAAAAAKEAEAQAARDLEAAVQAAAAAEAQAEEDRQAAAAAAAEAAASAAAARQEIIQKRKAQIEALRGQPDEKKLKQAILNTLCVKNFKVPDHFRNLSSLRKFFNDQPYATNDSILKEAVQLRLKDDPFKMFLLQRNTIEDPLLKDQAVTICEPTPRNEGIKVAKVTIPNTFNNIIYEEPTDPSSSLNNSKENFKAFLEVSQAEVSPNKTFMTYGPSGTGKTTIIKQIIKNECDRFNDTLRIRAMMVYAQHDPMEKELKKENTGRPTRVDHSSKEGRNFETIKSLGFLKFDFFDMIKAVTEDKNLSFNENPSNKEEISRVDLKDRTDKYIPYHNNLGHVSTFRQRFENKTISASNTQQKKYFTQCGYPEDDKNLKVLGDDILTGERTGFLSDVKATCDSRSYYNFDKYKLNLKPDADIKGSLDPQEFTISSKNEVPLLIDKIFHCARYRATANNRTSSRAILCFFVDYDNFSTTYIDLFGNEETLAENGMELNGIFRTEGSAIVVILDIIKAALESLRSKNLSLLEKAVDNRVSTLGANDTDKYLDEDLNEPVRNKVKNHLKLFFDLFKPKAQGPPQDFQLLVTSIRKFQDGDGSRIQRQILSHQTMLELVKSLSKPSMCVDRAGLEEKLTIKLEENVRDEDDIQKILDEYKLDTFVDPNNKTNETLSADPKDTPGLEYKREWKERGYPDLDDSGPDPVLEAQLASLSRTAGVSPPASQNRSPAPWASKSPPAPRGVLNASPANTGAQQAPPPHANASLQSQNDQIQKALLQYELTEPGTIKKFKNDPTLLVKWTRDLLGQDMKLPIAKAMLNNPKFKQYEGGRTHRGRKRHKTVKKYRFPKRKTHYRKFKRSRRRR